MAKKITESFSQKPDTIRRNAPEVYPEFLELGKMPPQSLSTEEAVLGVLILTVESRSQVLSILIPEVFYKEEHKIIFHALQELYTTSKQIDILILVNYLRKNELIDKIGGAYYLTELTNRVTSDANIMIWVAILVEKYVLREIIRITGIIQEEAYSESADCYLTLDKLNEDKKEIELFLQKLKTNSNLPNQVQQAMQNILLRISGEGYYPSRWPSVNDLIIGWMFAELIIIASRPSMGKTAMMLDDVEFQIAKDIKCQVFSIEMTATQLIQRMACTHTSISSSSVNKGKITPEQVKIINEYLLTLLNKNLIIDDTAKITTNQIRASIEKNEPKIVYIDYLQRIDAELSKSATRDQVVGKITADLKAIAKEFNIPIICLSTLNRDCERRTDKRPYLSDLRESGSIEYDADTIMTIWRPAQYKNLNIDGFTDAELKRHTEFYFHKNRNGIIGCVEMDWDGDHQLFSDKEDTSYYESAAEPVNNFGKDKIQPPY